ncbi:type II toxin-antitoxin system Phd/YefM family antitoxin [Actinoplanes sp. NPDC051633]|uniref:type II toxin-antitoxin system Phd/YefM family antitoxin n=1 Tax=Actinoplanes sp. NPDC051633 TaxID=3155670 RepID=UPI00342C861A
MMWQVQEVKQRFSEVLRAAKNGGPQIVTKRGEEVAVVIDIADYRRMRGETVSFMRFLQSGPVVDDGLDIERSTEPSRDVDLTD